MLKMEPQQLIIFLVYQTKLEEIGEATSEALDTELANGFNRHDLSHFLRNALRAHQILELIQSRDPQAKLTKEDFNLATLAAMLHDWGNLQGRKNHWIKSLLWLEKVFIDWTSPNLARAKAILQEAIFFHDEKALLKAKETGLLEELHQVTKVLFIADKMDVCSRRVSKLVVGQSTDQDIVDLDPHITLAAAVDSKEMAIAGDQLRWQLTTDWNKYLDIVFPASYPPIGEREFVGPANSLTPKT